MANNKYNRVKWNYKMVDLCFKKHKTIIKSHNYIKGDFSINSALPIFSYKYEFLPYTPYLDDIAGIYFEKTGKYLKPKNKDLFKQKYGF
ncbi:MAG TPA: hypothetical protein VN026_18020 [Bacteroidia bacterium]|jgi:hypothetical protein|nr:hypothetical protein [Bacteroidia bacterium]